MEVKTPFRIMPQVLVHETNLNGEEGRSKTAYKSVRIPGIVHPSQITSHGRYLRTLLGGKFPAVFKLNLQSERLSLASRFLQQNRYQKVPLKLGIEGDIVAQALEIKKEAAESWDIIKQFLNGLETEFIGDSDPETLRMLLPTLIDELDRGYDQLIKTYACWWQLKSENNSLSQLRTERLKNLSYKAYRNGDPQPYVVKIALPFSKWNKTFGELSATQLKWFLLEMLKDEYGHDRGLVTFIDSTGIALALDSNVYSEDLINNLSEGFPELLNSYLRRNSNSIDSVKLENNKLYIMNDHQKWVDADTVFSDDYFIGVSQVRKLSLETNIYKYDKEIRDQVHGAEIICRSRTEKVKDLVQAKEIENTSFGRVCIHIPEEELDLGVGYFPEGVVVRKYNIAQALAQIYLDFDGEEWLIPIQKEKFINYVENKKGLNIIWDIVKVIAKKDSDILPETFLRTLIFELQGYASNQVLKMANDIHEDEDSFVLEIFLNEATQLMKTSMEESELLYNFIYMGSEARVAHNAGRYAGSRGILTKLGEQIRELHDILSDDLDNHATLSQLREVFFELMSYQGLLDKLVEEDLLSALEDSRFPQKIKSIAFPYMVEELFGDDQEFEYLVFDYDNLSAFMKNPINKIVPRQMYDLSKYMLETVIYEVAVEFGLTPLKDVIYASPGGDEIQIAYSSKGLENEVSPKKFLEAIRQKLKDYWGQVQSPSTYKVPTNTGIQRWFILTNGKESGSNYDRLAIDLKDLKLVEEYLKAIASGQNDLSEFDRNRVIKVYRVQHLSDHKRKGEVQISLKDLAFYYWETCTVGLSATYFKMQTRTRHESMKDFIERLNEKTERAFILIDEAKSDYGKNQTWEFK